MSIIFAEATKIALFKGKRIRKILHQGEWWFSILDVVSVLANSPQPKTYWAKMKERDERMSQPFPFWEQLKTHKGFRSSNKMQSVEATLLELHEISLRKKLDDQSSQKIIFCRKKTNRKISVSMP